ncbi:hypothetical protein [Tychonema sp. BBK16]|uniref:hypothetical protein n=1 Tax=Tychonema sp. BBK16 TaxID=2699888 RepID=UPI001F44A894|nr:hypothetical protein [Tychonema sp. BBK16]MCF6373905.1 hypothetical protein [Tychonema sp. BBK16]
MSVVQHLWELILFLIILVGPIPLCLDLSFEQKQENSNYSFAHFLLVFLTGWSIIQVSTGLILGSCDRLNIYAVILAEFAIFVVGSSLIYYKKSRDFYVTNWQKLQLKESLSRWEWLIIISVTLVGIILLKNLATQPITNYDSLWFHLPVIARWYQTGSLTLLDATGNWIFEQEQAKIYPYNWHILSALSLLPFKTDFLAAFPMLIAWVIQGLSVYLLGVKFGATRIHSMGASSLVLTVPMMLNQVNTIHPDLPLAAIFTVGLYLGLSFYKSRSLSELSLFFASTGMLAGIKITGIVYAASLLGGLLILEIQRFLADIKFQKTKFKIFQLIKPVLLCGIVCLLLLGGFWYGRNLLLINYPASNVSKMEVPLQPVTIPSPVKPSTSWIQTSQSSVKPSTPLVKEQPVSPPFNIWQSTLAAQFNPTNISHWQTLGLQIIIRLQVPFIALAFQVLAVPLGFTKGKNRVINQNTIILIVVLFSTGILYLITPYTSGTAGESIGQLSPILGFNLRYGFPFLSVLGVAAAATATFLNTGNLVVVAVVVVSSFLGITSNTIFDYIKNASFTGDSIVWGSGLIDSFKSNPVAASKTVGQILAPHSAYILKDGIFYIVSIILLSWILFKINPGLGWLNNLFSNRKKISCILIVCVCVGLIVIGDWREKRDIACTEMYGGIHEYINENTVPNEKIGFFLSSRSYLFYGKNLNRKVLYVPFKADRISAWIDNLRHNGVRIVGFGPLTETDADTRKSLFWLTSAEGPLELVFGKDFKTESVLYRLKN